MTKLGEITSWSSGGTPPKDNPLFWNGDIPWISASSMRGITYSDSEHKLTLAGLKKGSKLAPKGALLILVRGSMLFNKIPVGIVSKDVAFNQDVKSIIVDKSSTSEYVLNWILANEAKILDIVTGTGIGAGKLDVQDLKNLEINIPSLGEQQKITNFLSILTERIQTQIKIIEDLNVLVKATVQSLESNGKRKNWQKTYLKDVLIERREMNTDNHKVHSVSVSKGVINQIEYLGRSFAAKDTTNYNVAHFGDVIYTKSPTGDFPYGIIKQCFISENVALSPLYGVFIPKSISLGTLLHFYFTNPVNNKNYLNSLIQKGAKNTINITNVAFLNNFIYLPIDPIEIDKISDMLFALNKKLLLETAVLNVYTRQKKYLLQNLFK